MTEEMKKVAAEICRCISCDSCNGTGSIRYLSNQFDDDDTETCDVIGSGGISGACDRCQLLSEMEDDARVRS